MSGSRITRQESPTGATPGEYIFSDGQKPPSYAVVRVQDSDPTVDDGDSYLIVSAGGPYAGDEALKLVTDGILTPEQQAARSRFKKEGPYNMLGADFITIEGNYPGGRDQIALNVARLVLGDTTK